MNKLYNTQKEMTSILKNFLNIHTSCLHKPQKNFLPEVLFSMILLKSVVAKNLALQLKDYFSSSQLPSIEKRISRHMKNSRFHGKTCFDQIMK